MLDISGTTLARGLPGSWTDKGEALERERANDH